MNRKTFYSYVRTAPFGGSLEQSQVDGMNAILDAWERSGLTDDRWLAYMLATVRWETNSKMQPVEENLNYTTAERIREVWPKRFTTLASARPYVRNPKELANKVYNGRMGNRAGTDDGWNYRGRGLPQLTGRSMYERFGIASNPSKALDLKTSVRILFDGMTQGLYTGVKLSDCFNDTIDDPIKARSIINSDRKKNGKIIADSYRNILDAIKAARKSYVPVRVEPGDDKPDDIQPVKSASFWTILAGLFGGGSGVATFSSQVIGSVNNGWALLALLSMLLILASGGVFAWMVYSGRLQILRPSAVARKVYASPEVTE
jgi:putative chitinase